MSAVEERIHRDLVRSAAEAMPDASGIAELVRDADPLRPPEAVTRSVSAILAQLDGLGVLEPLLRDPDVSDVMVNGPGPVWVERRGRLVETPVVLDRPQIELLVERIVAPLGKRADPVHALVDGRLADGSRVHVVVPPLAVDGPCITIRRFSVRPIGLEQLAAPPVASLLRWAVRSRCNVVVSGATGSGKTTLLNALAGDVPMGERIITVEDAAELRLSAPHVVRLESRPGSSDGVGEVTIRDLVRNALRMRPDRLLVGEVRGPEALRRRCASPHPAVPGGYRRLTRTLRPGRTAAVGRLPPRADPDGCPYDRGQAVPSVCMPDRVSRQRVSAATIGRFHEYSRVLTRLADATRDCTVSSSELGRLSGVSAASVRSDLATLGFRGQPGVGYRAGELAGGIARLLGLEGGRDVVIAGAGRLGVALAGYIADEAAGLRVSAIFDADAEKVGTAIRGLRVRDASEIEQSGLVGALAVVATPPGAAQQVTDGLVSAGVRSILNFAPANLQVPEGVSVRRLDVAGELHVLSYFEGLDPDF